VNISAPLCARLLQDHTDKALASRVAGIRADIAAHPLVPAVKYLVGRRAAESAWNRVLPPFQHLDAAACGSLDRIAQTL
jgi:4-hydroxy-tetrahydrodipicolinate synthase